VCVDELSAEHKVDPMTPRARARSFCQRFSLCIPILMGPMAGSSPPALAAEVANAGGLGACGAMLMGADGIAAWAADFRARSNGAFQVNTWVPGHTPATNPADAKRLRQRLAARGVAMGPIEEMGLPDFTEQCAAIIAARPPVASSIMGLYPPAVVDAFRRQGTAWFANVTSLAEAKAAEAGGADAIGGSGLKPSKILKVF